MEFSIQKIRRCGKSALRSHRREAARVVFLPFFCHFCFCCFWASTCIIIFRVHSSGKMKKRYGFLQESQLWYFCFFTFLFGWVPSVGIWKPVDQADCAYRLFFIIFFLSVFMAKQSLPVCISPFAKLSFCCWEFYPEAARQSFQL